MIHKRLEIFIIWNKGRFKVTKKEEVILEELFSVL